MPPHVRAVDLPTGVYWDRERHHWYTILAEGDRKRRVKLGSAKIALADLTTRLADVRGVDRTSLDWLMGAFHTSAEFTRLAPRTQADYARYRVAVSAFPTRAGKLGNLPAARLSTPLFQGIVDKLERAGTPTKANHWLRYLRRIYSFALRRTSLTFNPLKGVAGAHERKRRVVPSEAVYQSVLNFARKRGERTPFTEGSVAGYVWLTMELMYLCRLRSIEAVTLTDANALPDGVLTNRRKGSRDNIVAWTPRLREVWDCAVERRRVIFEKRRMPVPIAPERRLLLVGELGDAVSEHAIQESWASMMRRAIKAGAIRPDERFGTHGCKHKGISDSPGNRHDKQQASGHRSERMMDVYDHETPVVPTSERQKPA